MINVQVDGSVYEWIKIPATQNRPSDSKDLRNTLALIPGNGRFAVSYILDSVFFEKEEDAIMFVLKYGDR